MSEYEQPKDIAVEDLNSRNETWKIEFEGEKVHFSRWIGDKPYEMYRPLSLSEGAIAAAAIFQGFQPPHRLRRLDKPARRTEFE